MFLRTLTLKGFKSFAETTTLEFEPGLTVVVGPNGSGKSNIVDAVAWVLGAQGPRTVRSAKMEDVIFAGTAKRQALGRAEVSLTIDNSARLIPIDFSEVTITRTLWRSGESEYALNGAPCRLLDIQELLSDTGVGRQQHVIVGQGQLDAVLNAQPADRRVIIEEAAGVLKFRRRREKAQRRLDATEGNLLRVQDLLREVRRQMRPLERQADAARRHGDVVAELGALRIWLSGRELASLEARATAVAALRTDQVVVERELVAALDRLDGDIAAGEAALLAAEGAAEGAAGGDRRARRDLLADEVARAEGLRERARGLAALVTERRRSLERLRTIEVDADLVASLEGEAADLAAALVVVDDEIEQAGPEAAALEVAEAAVREARAAFEAMWPAGESGAPPGRNDAEAFHIDAPLPAGAGEVRGELIALGSALDRAAAERTRLDERHETLAAKASRLEIEAVELTAEASAGEDAEHALAAAADDAAAQRALAESALDAAEHALAAATGHQRSWAARAEALASALDEARARAGAERLATVDGLVGTLLDVVDVDPGWEAAFEAAIGDAVAAVVMADVEAARRALAQLHVDGAGGAVLALGASSETKTLVVAPSGSEAVRRHVRPASPAVGALLDRLLADAVAVDGSWADAMDLACGHPDLIVVTRGGDRFAPGGWRAGAGHAGATGAALDEAQSHATAAASDLDAARAAHGEAREAAAAARTAEAEALRVLDRHLARRAQLVADRQRVEVGRRDLAVEIEGVATHLAELGARLERDRARAAELTQVLPELEAEEAAGLERAAAQRAARGELEHQERELRERRTNFDVRAAGLAERRSLLERRRNEVDERLSHHLEERDSAEQRRLALTGHVVAVDRLGGLLVAHTSRLDAVVAERRTARQAHADATAALSTRLEELRRQRGIAERELLGVRERLQRAEVEDAEVRVRMETAVDTLRRELNCEPATATAATCPEVPPGTTPEHRARELERDLRLMGPINPLALEEHAALVERHTFLEAQLEDVKAGRRELTKVIRAIDSEIVDVFTSAYADVADNFTKLFATLFPGGTGRLQLTDPDNLLETGIEVEARPSGKNVKRLSLLSGGERSLTAMAFLFAVFRSRPSPFYLMDEVEAALDDINLHRFLDLIREFEHEAQLLIVSHQKRTMEAAACLYGVTMEPGGSSKVIGERIGAGAGTA